MHYFARAHSAASIPPNSSNISNLAMSLKVDPSRIFCIIEARPERALSLMREHVASAYFGREGTDLGDMYVGGEDSKQAGTELLCANPEGEGNAGNIPEIKLGEPVKNTGDCENSACG